MLLPRVLPAVLLPVLLLAAPAAAEVPLLRIDTRPVSPGTAHLVADPDAVLLEAELAVAETRDPSAAGLTTAEADSPATVRQQLVKEWEWAASSGSLEDFGPGRVRWYGQSDGEPAQISVRVSAGGGAEAPEAGVVLIPAVPFDVSGPGVIDGTIIGIYPNQFAEDVPAPVARNRALYAPPESFYRIDATTAEAPLAAGATLAGLNPPVFNDGGDRFVALDVRLLRFWSHFAAALQANGYEPHAARVLRGYLSPYDRQRLESMGIRLAEFTRFQYGDSLALVIDRNRDGRMDDVTGDGAVDIADAEALAVLVERGLDDAGLSGGIGIGGSFGGPDNIGTPFVQVDTRGVTVRWRED